VKEYTVRNDNGMEVTFQWNDPNPPTDADMDAIFAEAKRSKPGMVESALRTTGAVLGGIPAGITSGYFGLYDLGKNLVQGKGIDEALRSANEAVETTGSVPAQLLNTPGQQEAAQKIGETLMWPIEKAGEGWQEIIKQTPLKDTIAEPIANIFGQGAAMGAGGKMVTKPASAIARAIEAKRLAPLRAAQRAAGTDVPVQARPPIAQQGPAAEEFAAAFGAEKAGNVQRPPEMPFEKKIQVEPIDEARRLRAQFDAEQAAKQAAQPEVISPEKPFSASAESRMPVEKIPEVNWLETDEAAYAFSEMKSQLQGAQTKSVTEVGGETFVSGSSYPLWFREISRKHKISAKETTRIIDKIYAGDRLTDRQADIFYDIERAARKEAEPYAQYREQIDSLSRADQESLKSSSLSEIAAEESLSAEEFASLAKDLDEFFAKRPSFTNETGEIPGASAKETFGLINPETEISRGLNTFEKGPETATLYSNPIPQLMQQWTKYIGTPLWDFVWEKSLPKLLEKTGKPGKAILRGMDPDYRGGLKDTPSFNAILEKAKTDQSIGREYAIDIGNRLQSLAEPDQIQVGAYLRGEAPSLPGHISGLGKEAADTLMYLGKQAVDSGLLNEDVYFQNVGKYMPRLYTTKEYQGLLQKYNEPIPNRLDLQRFQKRKDIPKEIREQMGEILTPGYPVAKGIIQLTHDISLARMFKGMSENPEWILPKDVAQVPEGWVQLNSRKLGVLDQSYAHPEVARELNAVIQSRSEMAKMGGKAYGAWKYGKVIASPKTHMRNMMSNSIMAHLGGLPMYEQPYYLARAIKEMRAQGPAYMAVRQNSNIFRTGWAQNELRALYDASVSLEGLPEGSLFQTVPILRDAIVKGKKAGAKMAEIYQKEEQVFKMAKVLKNLEQGMDIRSACADANKWLFDYSKVTRFQEKYRNSPLGAPFATFTIKALPRVFEAGVKTPWRFALPAAMIYGLEEWAQDFVGDTDEQKKAKGELRPDYMKGSTLGLFPNFPRVPVVDDYGREYYLDLTYILPWGDIAQSGKWGMLPGSVRPLSHPATNELVSQIFNYDQFWQKPIVDESDTAGMNKLGQYRPEITERFKHAGQTFLPTPVMDAAKLKATISEEPDYRGREKGLGTALADIGMGLKMTPVDYQDQMRRFAAKNDPGRGRLAQEIKNNIKREAIRMQFEQSKGRSGEKYREKIEGYVRQLQGLSGMMGKQADYYRTAMGQ
jgi:hypothetical protein